MKLNALEKLARSQHENVLAIELLLRFVLKQDANFLFLNPNYELSDEELALFEINFEKLKNGFPIEYILQEKEFYGLKFKVTPDVLIPRPESEMFVDLVLDLIAKTPSLNEKTELKVLDIGTGSGNIILALASRLKNINAVGVDLSEEALKIAQENAKNLKLSNLVRFQKSNLMLDLKESFDLVVANLPYIGTEKFNFVAKDTKEFEPDLALFGGSDGLELYRELFQQIIALSAKPQYVLGEFGFGQSELMQQVLEENFQQTGKWEIIDDLAGIPRIFILKL